MAEGGAENFLRAAEQGRMTHNATASAAAAAMNAMRPAPRVQESTTERVEEPMKVSIDAGPAAKMGGSTPSSRLKAAAAVDEPSRGPKPPPAPDMQNWGGGAMDMQAQQAAMMAQMNMGMYNPYAMAGSPMGFPWGGGWPMDPSFMMGKGGMPFPPMPMQNMFGMPQVGPGMMPSSPAGGKGSKKGGGGGANAGGGGDKKGERKKRSAKAKSGQAAQPPAESPEAAANRSPELNEIHKNHGKSNLTLEQVKPQIIEFAMDQHGYRFLLTKLEETNEGDKTIVFNAVLPQTKTLANDVFGNFVVQKLFDICHLDQKKQLAEQLQGMVMQLSLETYGCRVIQKALQLLPRESQQQLASELQKHVPQCIESMHGNHVIQKCIEQMPPDSVTFIISSVNEKVEAWASHMYGCRVIQRLLEHCTSQQLPRMLDLIMASVKKLAVDPYGNYVVQHVLEHGRKEDKSAIIHAVSGNIAEFSRNKCSSNVVEKCVEIAAIGEHASQLEGERQMLYIAVLGHAGDPHPPLVQMMDDRFGNYIVQRMIEYSKGDDRQMLQNKLHSMQHVLERSTNGKHILSALHKEFGG